jgi:hypothetical protein
MAAKCSPDVIDGGRPDKDHHDWGHGKAEVHHLLTRLKEPR